MQEVRLRRKISVQHAISATTLFMKAGSVWKWKRLISSYGVMRGERFCKAWFFESRNDTDDAFLSRYQLKFKLQEEEHAKEAFRIQWELAQADLKRPWWKKLFGVK